MYGKLFVLATIFALGLYFITHHSNLKQKDGFTSHRCPNVLIQEGSKINLFNTNLAEVPGVNPIQFENLNEYVDFMRWQRSQGIRCPVLYLQQAYDVQNNPVYKARPDPDNMNAGAPDFNVNSEEANKLLDATRDDPPYNTNSFPAYDPDNQYIGIDTPLDKMFNASDGEVSVNAMDTTWGGEDYANNLFKETTK
jgi:hypothetical protein